MLLMLERFESDDLELAMLSDLQPIGEFRTLHADEPFNCQILRDALYSAHLNGSASLTVIYQTDPVPSWGSRTVLLRAGGIILRKVCTQSGAWTGHYKPLKFQVVAREIYNNIVGDDFPCEDSDNDNHANSGIDNVSDEITKTSRQDGYFVISDCAGFRAEHAIRQSITESHGNAPQFHDTLGFPVPSCVPLDSSRQGRTRSKPQFVEQRLACVLQRKDQYDQYDKWSIGGPDKLPDFLFLLTEYSRRPRLIPVLVALGFVHPSLLPENLQERPPTLRTSFGSRESVSDHRPNSSSQRPTTPTRFPLSITIAGLLNTIIITLDAISRILRQFSGTAPPHRRPLPRREGQTENMT